MGFPFCSTPLCLTNSLSFVHHSPLEDFFLIHSLVGMHQGDLLTWPIFALAHFHTLQCCKGFPFCIFPSFLDIHIINLAFIIPFLYSILFLSWLLWGLWSNLASVMLGHPLIHFLTSFLLLIFIVF